MRLLGVQGPCQCGQETSLQGIIEIEGGDLTLLLYAL